MKRIVLYRFGREPAEGLVRPDSYLVGGPTEFLTVSGDIQSIPSSEIKALCFVSDSGRPDLFTANTQFERRPKSNGLWTRFMLRDGDQLEGLLAHNLVDWPSGGYFLTPPRAGVSRQRVYLPRSAVLTTELLGLVGAARSGSATKGRQTAARMGQLKMFDQ